MNRASCLGIVLLLAPACATPPERVPLRSLPDDSQPLPYAELLTRARFQAQAATEAFYVNKWSDVEDAAKGLEQTARFLGKATDVPAKFKDSLPVLSTDLGKEASKLKEAAKTSETQQANETLQRIHLKVRELRLDM